MGNTFMKQEGGSLEEQNTNENMDMDKDMDMNLSSLESIDQQISSFILSLNVDTMKKMYSKKYCNQLTKMTSNVLENTCSETHLYQLYQRIFLSSSSSSSSSSKNKQSITSIQINELAKFFVKIAHIYSAIMTTLNPKYTYIDSQGNKQTVPFHKKDIIPSDAIIEKMDSNVCELKYQTLNQLNIKSPSQQNCSTTLYEKEKGEKKETNEKENEDKKDSEKETSMNSMFPELQALYIDDGYDIQKKTFTTMSPQSKEDYEKHMNIFYQVYTQETNVPIKMFHEISLQQYGKQSTVCSLLTNERKQKTSETSYFMAEYAENIRNMMLTMNDTQQQLIDILHELFLFNEKEIIQLQSNPLSEEKEIIQIHPELTNKRLTQLIQITRELIITLYVECETKYQTGLQLYEAIIESLKFHSTKQKINNLQKLKYKLFDDDVY